MQATLSRARNNMISGITAATAVALGLVAVSFTSSRAQEPPPPILVELLTPRSVFTEDVRGQFGITLGGHVVCAPGLPPTPRPAPFFVPTPDCLGWVPNDHPLAGRTDVLNMPDLSLTVVARITVQPGAQFPWHTHPGPVIVNIAQGELVYVEASDCIERPYPAGTAFVDPGRGHVHTAFNRTGGVTVIYATFFEVPAQGALTITAGVEAPANCQVGTLPTPPTPPPSNGRLQMSGRVLDQNGTPLAGALVAVDYSSAGGVSSPPSTCPFASFCWLATRTNDLGEYSVEFEPRPWPGRGLGYVYSHHDGYQVDVQWVPTGSSPAVRDMRLRPTRSIPAGESTVVSVDATSSLCTDLEDLWVMESRCEIVVIESGAGVLNVEARPAAGGPPPSIFWYTTGNYDGFITQPAPGTVAIPVRGGTYRILVGVPDGAPPQQFNVTTTLR